MKSETMVTRAFKGISFKLPGQSPLDVAVHIGTLCGNAWYEWEGDREFLNGRPYPMEIQHWPFAAKEAWRSAALDAWHERMGVAARRPVVAALENRRIGYQRYGDEQQRRQQRGALVTAGVDPDRILEDPVSGSSRMALQQAMRILTGGDTLVVYRLDSLAGSLGDLVRIVQTLEEKQVGLLSLQDQIDTTADSGQNFFPILRALAGFQSYVGRGGRSDRPAPGRTDGRKPGRKRKLKEQDLRLARTLLRDESITVAEVARRLGVSSATLYRELPGGRSGVD